MVPIMAGGGLYFFIYFDKALRHDVDEELVFDKMHWQDFLKKKNPKNKPFELYSPEILIYKTPKSLDKHPILRDTIIFQEYEHEYDPYRELSQVLPVGKDHYYILIRKSLLEKRKLARHITEIMGWVLISVFMVTILLNWIINKRIWAPFYLTLFKLKKLNLQHIEVFKLERNSIKEFKDLNQALDLMASQIQKDFKTLKEFTEDAAHEMQTPLSIAQNKLEILLQDPELKESQIQPIIQSSEALNRLNRLNTSLLLMAKIDNSQFMAEKALSINPVLEKYLLLFQEFIIDKSLEVKKTKVDDFLLIINPLLADTLISNLLGNAIKYNIQNGLIEIETRKDSMIIKNQSLEGEIDPKKIFKRFHKTGNYPNGNSNGLGLSIIKKITDTHHLNLYYSYQEGMHTFLIQNENP